MKLRFTFGTDSRAAPLDACFAWNLVEIFRKRLQQSLVQMFIALYGHTVASAFVTRD